MSMAITASPLDTTRHHLGSQRSQEAEATSSPAGHNGSASRRSRKLRAVSRLLRGEPLELVARELNVTAARLSEWRDRALLAAEALKEAQ